ncbi:unnamed protein product [Lupinus luteus]|uniref:inositol oxygenase n=1 Tax=Lupinus luteus TaxID=3873 RepID=A0AAV1YFG8_LUPLU
MTILIEQPRLEIQYERKVHAEETNELVLDGEFPLPQKLSQDGFHAPDINSFGKAFRVYDAESERQKKKHYQEFYKKQHINQTYEFVKRMREENQKSLLAI